MADLLTTPLHDLHQRLGARMVPFAGYLMPVSYPQGIIAEHRACRERAALFDVSHMGQVELVPRSGDRAEAARALERLVPVDVLGLAGGRQRYAMFTTPEGGILDDLMVAALPGRLFLVVNAARKEEDWVHLQEDAGRECDVRLREDRALLALQGPEAGGVLAAMAPETAEMRFMDVREVAVAGVPCIVSRSGYTGEDGFEISLPASEAARIAGALLDHEAVSPGGLGARDSLRLEAGLPLHGSDIGPTTSPVEAALGWAIQKVRRRGGAREGGFPGADRILAELGHGPARLRVGLRPEGRAPVRAHAALFAGEEGGEPVGTVTSGGFGPTVGAPVSMGYLPAEMAAPGTRAFAEVRGRRLAVEVAALPFVPTSYRKA